MSRYQTTLLLTCGIIGLQAVAQADLQNARFIPATPENTRLADGSPLPDDLGDCGWRWRPEIGNGGVLESMPGKEERSSILVALAGGLQPGATYEVFAYFWADGFGGGVAPRQRRPAQLGLTMATLQTFDGITPPVDGEVQTWMVTPGSKVGGKYGYAAFIEADDPLKGIPKLKSEDGDSRLIRARLGFSKAGKDGTLPVFFDDYPYDNLAGHACIDGIALRPAKADAPVEIGWTPGTRIHLALRAGDPISFRRELEAGADVNAFDEENLTPLFYAAAAGDSGNVRMLLAKGANPDQPGQSVPPLSAAATASSVDTVRMLLGAGAGVPRELAKDSGKLANPVHPAYIHPIICAIRAGSLPALRLLMERVPGLQIQSLIPLDAGNRSGSGNTHPPTPEFIAEAINERHWELAAFLIDHGAGINLSSSGSGSGMDEYLMAGACAAGIDGLPAIEAMLRRGILPVKDPYEKGWPYPRTQHYQTPGVSLTNLEPWDGLSAAVSNQHSALVKRFLPAAKGTTHRYQDTLLMTALYSQNAEITGMILSQFPDADPLRWKPSLDEENEQGLRDKDLRRLLPRTTPLPQSAREGENGKNVLAVISSPGASGPAAALAAMASAKEGWEVVDRELIESALGEERFSKPWLNGEHRLADLGDLLSANTLIITSKIEGKSNSLYRFEVVEVASGLVVHREHVKGETFTPEADFPPLLGRAAQAMHAASRNERHQAVTLLSFSARGELNDKIALARLLEASVQREVDSTPGLISLSRLQSSHLVEEQAFQGENSIWGSSHLVEGAVSPAGEGRIKVALRLETLKDGGSVKTDAEAVGDIQSTPELVTEAWTKLFGTAEGIISKSNGGSYAETAKQESKRLLREAEWLIATNVPARTVIPLIETASAMGAPLEEVMPLHLDCLYRQITSVRKTYWSSSNSQTISEYKIPGLPVPLDLADKIAYQLPEARQFLHHVSLYFDSHGTDFLEGEMKRRSSRNVFWDSIKALSFIRSSIYEKELPPECRDEYATFASELDEFTKRYFQLLPRVTNTYIQSDIRGLSEDALVRNPELKRGVLEMGLRAGNLSFFGFGSVLSDPSHFEKAMNILDRDASDAITGEERSYMKAYLRYFMVDPAQRHEASLRFIEASAARLPDLQVKFPGPANRFIEKVTTSKLFGDATIPTHGASLIPSLFHAPRPSPDLKIRFQAYRAMRNIRNSNQADIEQRKKVLKRLDSGGHFAKLAVGQPSVNDESTLEQALHTASLWELVSGFSHRSALERLLRRKSPDDVAVSSKISLMTDFRQVTHDTVGNSRWPMVDSANPNLLWIYHFPSANQRLGGLNIYHRYLSVWLLAIDCSDGKVVHRIDLKSELGKSLGRDLTNFTGSSNADILFDQTQEKIMMAFTLNDIDKREPLSVAMMVDKESGKVAMLPLGTYISSADWYSQRASRVAALGDSFYFLDSFREREKGTERSTFANHGLCVFKVRPDLEMEAITEFGRRPELTPFDAEDRIPKAVAANDGKLFVFGDNIAHSYDPADGTWSERINPKRSSEEVAQGIFNRNYGKVFNQVFALHIGGEDTGWSIRGAEKPMGSHLQYFKKGVGLRVVPTPLEIPADFRNTTVVTVDGGEKSAENTLGYMDKSFEEFTKDEILQAVVLNQTDTDLILAIKIGSRFLWKGSSQVGDFLPFLWKVPKSEIFSALNDFETGGTR